MAHTRGQLSLLFSVLGSIALHLAVIIPVLLMVLTTQGEPQGIRAELLPEDEAADEDDALPPPDEPDQPTLGIEESNHSTVTWVGYDEYLEHLARLSEVEQAAFRQDEIGLPEPAMPQVGESPVEQIAEASQAAPESAPEPFEPTLTLDAEPMRMKQVEPVEAIESEPSIAAEPDDTAQRIEEEYARTPIDAGERPDDSPIEQVASPDEEVDEGAARSPTPDFLQNPIPTVTDRIDEGLAIDAREKASDEPDPGESIVIEAAAPPPDDDDPSSEEVDEGVDARIEDGGADEAAAPMVDHESQRPDLAADETQVDADARDIQEPEPADEDAREPREPSSQPSPSDATPLGEPAEGEVADRDADASSIIDVPPENWRLGRPLAAEGIELKPQRPQFTLLQRMSTSPGNPVVVIRFGGNGAPITAAIVRSSGDRSIDAFLESSLYRWRASGKAIDALREEQTTDIQIRIIFNPRAARAEDRAADESN